MITGGGGFVLSNLARHWLDSDPHARVMVLDSSPPDQAAERFFAPVRDRLDYHQADVLEPDSWAAAAEAAGVSRVVHAATITSIAGATEPDAPDGTIEDPRQLLAVNVVGTANLLHWAANQSGLKRFIYVSSGSVYGDGPPDGSPVPEEGYVNPDGFYAISKQAAELLTRRHADVMGLDAVSVRFSGVFGPMDRVTPARSVRCAPNVIAHGAVAGETVTVNDPSGFGDWIHAGDVADGLAHMLRAETLDHAVYNIAYGELKTFGDLLAYTTEAVPGARWETAPDHEAHVLADVRRRSGRFGAYDISRMTEEFGWRPRPLRDAMHHYIDWIRENES
ncbi:MAG: NAD(P)-dependent oxidoreductase [Alphaproteobacteria bacterium]